MAGQLGTGHPTPRVLENVQPVVGIIIQREVKDPTPKPEIMRLPKAKRLSNIWKESNTTVRSIMLF